MSVAEHAETRGLPASVDAEIAILGAILLSAGRIYPEVAGSLDPDDFILDSHRTMFRRMGQMRGPIDLVTLSTALDDHRELAAIGGAGYLAQLTDGIPRLDNVSHYIGLVKQKAGLRRIIAVSNQVASRALDASEDPELVAADAQRSLAEFAERNAGGLVGLPEIFREKIQSLEALSGQTERSMGIRTGFREFDAKTCGMRRGELLIIAARPSLGKTAIALNIAAHVAQNTHEPVAIFSLEMTAEAVFTRMLNAEARANGHRVRQGMASREDILRLSHTLPQMMSWPIYVDDQASVRPEVIAARAKALKTRLGGMGLIVVDYLQLIDAGTGRNDNRVQEVSRISRAMKRMAKEVDCPVICLSQLNRAPEDRGGRPRLSDLRESGQIEQDADVVAFLWKANQSKANDHPSRRQDGEQTPPHAPGEAGRNDGETFFTIDKQRNGPIGDTTLAFVSAYARFENIAEGFDEEAAREAEQRRFGE